ncbi:MAG: hypothetical protein JO267_11920 [Alphaproteobacteria bacterium]|nr:hypothetical protein [Alphaproteobacteria bacterium]
MTETAITIPAPPAPAAAKPWPGVHWWHNQDGFGFHDLLDTINPLQHIPVISTVYRAITHDEPGAVSRIVGDGLFGGMTGFASSVVNVLVQASTGKDIGEHVLSLLDLDGDSGGGGKASAQAAAAKPVATGRTPMPLSPSRYILPTGTAAAPASPDAPAHTAAPAPEPGGAAASSEGPGGGTADKPASGGGSSLAAVPAAPGRPLGPSLVQRPVPLRLTGLLLPNTRPKTVGAGGSATAPSPAAAPVAANSAAANAAATTPGIPAAVNAAAAPPASGSIAAAPDAAAATAAPPAASGSAAAPGGTGSAQSQALEISEQMSDALDKYARMMQARQSKPASAGAQVNVLQ